MSNIVPLKKEHLKSLLAQPMNEKDRRLFDDEFIQGLEDTGAFITMVYDGKVMACGGITPYWTGRGEVWTMFSEESKKYFVPTFRMIKWWLHQQLKSNYRRIELSVFPEDERARRRAEMLGFKCETERAKKYLPTGEDCSIYAMVRM